MSVYRSGALLTPPHGTNGHVGHLIDIDPITWRCTRCHAVTVGDAAWRAMTAAGWCTGALAALPAPQIDRDDRDDLDDLDDDEPVTVDGFTDVDAVAHAVRSVFDITAAAHTDPIARSNQCGGHMIGWRYDACSARGPLTIQGDGWTRSWPRKRVAAAVAAACTDPATAAGLDRWRALSRELSLLADRWSWKDPVSAADIETERRQLRRDLEERYSIAAAIDLLGLPTTTPVDVQLSLFEATT